MRIDERLLHVVACKYDLQIIYILAHKSMQFRDICLSHMIYN